MLRVSTRVESGLWTFLAIPPFPATHRSTPNRSTPNRLTLATCQSSTTSIVVEYELDNEPLPEVGDRGVVVDSNEQPVCVTEVTSVRVTALGSVDLAHARDEGEGYESVAAWRDGHESFWHSDEYRAAIGNPTYTVTDATEAVLVRFRVLTRI